MNIRNLITSFLIAIFVITLSSCDDDPALPDILVSFETETLGFDGNETTIKVKLTRTTHKEAALSVALSPVRLTYGVDFTTEPDGSTGTITLTIPAGGQEVSLKVMRPEDVFYNGDEYIDFTITAAGDPLVLSKLVTSRLSFSPITSEGGRLQLEGKTEESAYANNVYIDLSGNRQYPVSRKSWNLAFYNGSDFRVILNPSYQTTAAALDKTDIAAVTLADAENVPNLNHEITDPNSIALVDSWDGDISKTVFAPVSATASENKVYLVSFEGNKEKEQWYKVKVDRNGEGYRLQYAKIGEATIQTIDITKHAAYHFTFVSLESGKVETVEPLKSNWDIVWGYSTFNSGMNTPYWFQDFVSLNHLGGASAAEVVKADATEAEEAYSNFSEADIASLDFLNTRDAIGSKWRSTAPGVTAGIRRDRFYVVKDPHGNVYKLKFVSMGLASDGGERGRPVIEYALVKKAD